jgi:GT2 family glycosyltransferase
MRENPATSLTISIVCFNSPKEELLALIESTLAAIQQLKPSVNLAPISIFIVDNSVESTLSLQLFSKLQSQLDQLNVQLKLIHGQGNIGYGTAHNMVISKVESDYHLLLNPDLFIDSNCLLAGLSYLSENETVVVASPHAEYENGEKQYLCKRYPSVLTFIVRGFLPGFLRTLFSRRLQKFEMHDLAEDSPTTDIPIVSGCFMLCRTKALQDLKGFDEGYFLYFEDFDLSLRLSALGKLAYVPAMRITHGGGHAAKKGWAHIRMFASSGIRFFNTHGWRFFRQA